LELDRVNKGDRAAFHELVHASWGPLVRYCRRIASSDDAAQDAAQEALVRLWEHRESWSGGSARAVLFRIARNVALDERRRAVVRSRAAATPGLAPGGPPTPEDELGASGLRDRVVAALDSLPERRREVFELVRRQGLSYREVSGVMGISMQTVANQMSLAMRDLRVLLADALGEAPPAANAGDRRTVDG
jgi:RNA polymerase sigma-70 factor (ECF subfamily)